MLDSTSNLLVSMGSTLSQRTVQPILLKSNTDQEIIGELLAGSPTDIWHVWLLPDSAPLRNEVCGLNILYARQSDN